MKALYVHNYYREFGGSDAVFLAEKKLLEDHGDEVTVYTRDSGETAGYGIREKAAFIPAAVHSRRTAREVRLLVGIHRPELAYIHNVYPLISPSVYFALHALDVPVIQAVDDIRLPLLCPQGCFFRNGSICESCRRGNYLHMIANRCIKDSFLVSSLYAAAFGLNRGAGVREKIDAWVCMTGFFKAMLLEAGFPEDRVFVNPPFIDPVPHTASEGKGDYALYFGRLSPEKGLPTLLRTFERMRQRRLVIMGTGPQEALLKSYAREKELSNVEFVGFKTGEEKRRVIENCLFAVVPSEWHEIFGLVILEAWAAGKPVIGSSLGSIPYVIEDGRSGLIFEAGNSDDLAAKIDHLWTHPSELQAMGKRGRHLVVTEYAPETNYLRKQEIFRSTIGSRNASPASGRISR